MDAGERGIEQINVYIPSLSSSSEYLPFVLFLGFPGGSDHKESPSNEGDLSSIPRVGRSSGGRHGNPHQYSCLENPWTKESPQGHKELDITEATEHARMHTYTKPWIEHRDSQGFWTPWHTSCRTKGDKEFFWPTQEKLV